MGPLALLNHAINFAAPALWLALLLPVLGRFLMKKSRSAHTLPALIAINFIVCTVTLLGGLVLFGQDGKMLTYFSLVAASASCQWFMQKG
mgnify:CR=1 FL=1